MSETLLPIAWPFAGLSETFGFGDQEPGTAREYQNVRGLDCRTGRLRGGKRSGLSPYMTSALKLTGTKCQDLLAFFQDNRQVEYAAYAAGSETSTWGTATPSKKDCLNVKTDRQGNVYALDGNSGVAKYGADGTLLWQIAIPVIDTNHVIRALAISDQDLVYVGVSSGGLQSKAKLMCFEQLPDDKTQKLWELTPDAYIEDMVIFQNRLYTAQNRVDRAKSYVRVYNFIDDVEPLLDQQWRIPYPCNSLAVKKSGEVVVACEAVDGNATTYSWRLPDPRAPQGSSSRDNLSIDSVDWTPYQLTDYDKRVWAWYVADDIDQSDVATDIADGVEVLRWRDRSKNNRHLFAPIDELDKGPVLAMDGLLEHKAVRWTKGGTAHPLQALKSLPNASIETELADQQRTMLPSYTDSSWAMYIVCRPSLDAPPGDNVPRWLFGQNRTNTSSSSLINMLFVNATDTAGNTLPPNSSVGRLFWFEGAAPTSGGSGTAGQIRTKVFTGEDGRLCVIALVFDGLVSGDTQQSLFQLNGNPVDLFQSLSAATLNPTYLGVHHSAEDGGIDPSSGVSAYIGDILEILVLDRRSRTTASQNVLTYDALEASSGSSTQTINENTVIVGYLEHKFGGQLNLPSVKAPNNTFPHPFGLTGSSPDFMAGPPNQAGTAVSDEQARANKAWACVVKYSAEGKILWCANEQATGDATRPGGFGYAVAVNSDGNIYSMGPNPTGTSGGTQQVRMIIDNGTSFSLAAGDGAWSASWPSNAEQDYHYPRVDVDEFDNFYLPYYELSASVASFRTYSKTGTLLHSRLFSSPQLGTAVAVDRKIPDYRNDLTTKTVEHVIVAGIAASIGLNTVVKARIVSATQTGDPPRTLITMGASGGDIVTFTTSGPTTPTGGSGALDATAYVQSTTLYKKAYWTDGRQYRTYDPVTGLITEYKGTTAGAIPARCALIESWRGRIVLARSADEPHNWFLSKKDAPNNFDYFPPVPGETDAVAGNLSPAGLCPDIINTVVPYNEDILVFGCDHSIWMLVGDPAAGGRIELVSDITGMSFGRPWTKDPNGVLYFFGSRGGVFRWTPGALPERVSLMKIERQLQDVDLSSSYVRLAYNHKDEGIHILQCPFGAGGTQLNHWFFEQKTESFALDIFGTSSVTNVQPTAVCSVDGDTFDDRAIFFGCEDGHVRFWDRAAKSDDTRTDGTTKVAIDGKVLIGPLQVGSMVFETQFSGLTVVLSEQDDGARWELFSAESPESVGIVQRSGYLTGGRNPPKWDRVTGPYCWLRLRNSASEERFAFERAAIRASPAGESIAKSY